MKFLLQTVLIFILFIQLNFVFAAETPENIKVLEASDTTISLDWDDVSGALGYYMYYGLESATGGVYQIEGADIIEESMFTLSNLEANTRYYIAITSIDEYGTESPYSNEIDYETLDQGSESQSVSLKISDVEVIDDVSIELIFSADIETGVSASREFIITEKGSGTEIPVDISDVLDGEPKNVLVFLGTALSPNTQYEIVVLDISDTQGNTIESGIDAFITFTTPNVFATDLSSAGAEESIPEGNTPLNEENGVIEDDNDNQDIENTEEIESVESQVETKIGNNAGTSITLSDNTLTAASENETLPQTGPEHWILAFVALLLAAGLGYTSFLKRD